MKKRNRADRNYLVVSQFFITFAHELKTIKSMNAYIRKQNQKASASMMRRYLLKEQGYEDDVVNNMSYAELKETYDYWHNEW